MTATCRRSEKAGAEGSRPQLPHLPQELLDMIIRHAYDRRSAELRLITKTSWDKREQTRAREGRQAISFPGSMAAKLLVCKAFFQVAAPVYMSSGPVHLQDAFHTRQLAEGTGVIGAYAKDVILFFSDSLYFPPMLKMEKLELVARGRLLNIESETWWTRLDRQELEDALRPSNSLHGIEPHVQLKLRGHPYDLVQHIDDGVMQAILQTLESILKDRIKSGSSSRSSWRPSVDFTTNEPTSLYPGSRVATAACVLPSKETPGTALRAKGAERAKKEREYARGSTIDGPKLCGARECDGIDSRLRQWTERDAIKKKPYCAGPFSGGRISMEIKSFPPSQELSTSGILTVETKPQIAETAAGPMEDVSRRPSNRTRTSVDATPPSSAIDLPDRPHDKSLEAKAQKAQAFVDPSISSPAWARFELLMAQAEGDAAALAWIEEQRNLLDEQLVQEIRAKVRSVAEKTTLAIGILIILFLLHCGIMHASVVPLKLKGLRSFAAETIHQWAYGL